MLHKKTAAVNQQPQFFYKEVFCLRQAMGIFTAALMHFVHCIKGFVKTGLSH